jgi:hypothetical protein
MDIKNKVDSLSDRMDKLSKNFDLSDELTETGNEIIDFLDEKNDDIQIYNNLSDNEVVNLKILVDDFCYIRNTLKESTDNGRRILNIVTLDLLKDNIDDDKKNKLISSFAELNSAICNNVKMYILSYRQISLTLLNIDQYKKQAIDNSEPKNKNKMNISTTDLIKKLKKTE